MLAYYISQSNAYTFRVAPATTNEFTMSLEDLTTLRTFDATLTDISYSAYESILSFTASISGAIVGEEYTAVVTNTTTDTSPVNVWNGSVQVYTSQSIEKYDYQTQNNEFVSNVSENRYIIMD